MTLNQGEKEEARVFSSSEINMKPRGRPDKQTGPVMD